MFLAQGHILDVVHNFKWNVWNVYCLHDVNLGLRTPAIVTVFHKTVCHSLQDFCTQACMEKYDQMSNNQPPPVAMHQCAVCNNEKIVKVEVMLDNRLHKLCSEPCFAAFKFVNKINAGWCSVNPSHKNITLCMISGFPFL
jgi:hypothetical protein